MFKRSIQILPSCIFTSFYMQNSIFLTKRKRSRFSRKIYSVVSHLGGFVTKKRQRFVLSVLFLSVGLFLSENILTRSGFFIVIFLGVIADFLLFISLRKDMEESNVKFPLYAFILPFFYTLSFGLFYFLVPARFLTKVLITMLYAIGLYSLFLVQNIFLVASVRTIALIAGARIISFLLAIVSFFFLSDVIFTFDLSIVPTSFLILLSSFCLIMQSIWTVQMDKSFSTIFKWTSVLSICMFEISLILGFWTTNSTVIAIFLTGFLYILVGLTQAWLDKRLFRGVIWEYIWVGTVVFCLLLLFTFI